MARYLFGAASGLLTFVLVVFAVDAFGGAVKHRNRPKSSYLLSTGDFLMVGAGAVFFALLFGGLTAWIFGW